MKPLNQPERRTRLWQFSLLYLLAMLIPVGAAYYLFSNSSIADENARLKQELDRTQVEQARMITQFDSLTSYLKHIDGLDRRLLAEPNPQLQSEYVNKIQTNLTLIAARQSELRGDSAQMQVAAHRVIARNILRDFELFNSTRYVINALRSELARAGQGDKDTQRLLAELATANQKAAAAEAKATQLQIALSSGGGGGGGGGGPRPVAAVRESSLVPLLRDQIAFAEADCQRQRALDKKPRSKERRKLLESSRTAFIQILQDPATDDLKQSIEKTLEPINLELGRPARFFGLL